MKPWIIVSILILLGISLYRMPTKRKYKHDNIGRRSGKNRRKKFDARKDRMRRSGKDRRTQKDRRQLLRFK